MRSNKNQFDQVDWNVSSHRVSLLYLTSILFMTSGCLIYIGYVSHLKMEITRPFFRRGTYVLPIITIISGFVVFFITMLGCCSAVKERRGWCNLFMTFMLIFGIIQTCIAMTAFRLRHDLETPLLKPVIKEFASYNTNPEAANRWDDFQEKAGCCGVEGSEDYDVLNRRPPVSCCATDECREDPSAELAVKRGCIHAFMDNERNALRRVGYISIFTAFIQLGGAAYSCCLLRPIEVQVTPVVNTRSIHGHENKH